MNRPGWLRRILRWTLAAVLLIAVLLGAQITLLARPQILLSDHVQVGMIQLYHDGESSPELMQLAADADRRLRASGMCDTTASHRVFYFHNPGRYTLFARLAMVTPRAQGFALSIFGNAYVSEQGVIALGNQTNRQPKYGTWEGNPAHTIAHEIGHLIVTDKIGRSAWSRLPHWKQEGLPEYIANIGIIREDSLATLAHRLRVLQTDWRWGGGARWDRTHYEAGLLVEYLFDVEGFTIDKILSDTITKHETLASLAAWCDARSSTN